MKNPLLVSITIILAALLMACQPEEKLTDKAEIQEIPNSKNGLVLTSTKQSYHTSDSELSATIINEGTDEVMLGTYLFVQKKVDGVWYEFPYKQEFFDEPANTLAHNESADYELDVSLLQHKLTPGEYRFIVQWDGPAAPFEVTKN